MHDALAISQVVLWIIVVILAATVLGRGINANRRV